ncbi:hypothetical protein PVK06_030160 [Gossypium arboreum]|uniref:Response regulatory domain-containing protein n=1 Tax=Gossypium arboreum TaxID=29729 RepID=A0ABR0NMI9_GOSAR|nr:hypothetical protein PVK06_030160 [Gossypium arboreum]
MWMPNENGTHMNLTHELKASSSRSSFPQPIPMSDPDVKEIKGSEEMPILQGYNFKGGTPELVETCYAIPVLVLPSANSRNWSIPEMEIVEVVADQERKNAMIASQARNSFQKVMSNGMKRPMHSILSLLSVFQDENINFKQKTIVDTLVKTSSVLSTLINDVMEISAKDNGRFLLNMRPFSLHSMIKETCCLAKCLSIYKGFDFEVGVQSSLPDQVIGDERRTFQNSYSKFRGLRVLLADDDDINRTVTKKLLEKLGCEVTAVSSGFECLSAVSHAENSFRIVVLDLHMPEMDGFKVAMRIREMPTNRNECNPSETYFIARNGRRASKSFAADRGRDLRSRLYFRPMGTVYLFNPG